MALYYILYPYEPMIVVPQHKQHKSDTTRGIELRCDSQQSSPPPLYLAEEESLRC